MIENVRRRIMTIAAFLAVAITLLVLEEPSLRLGLDLAGGSRLVYEFPFEEHPDWNSADPSQQTKLINETIEIVRLRVDPQGVKEPQIRRAGSNRIEIAIPGTTDVQGGAVSSTLGEPLAPETADGGRIVLGADDETVVAGFSAGGGVVRIGAEKIRYTRREGDSLIIGQRGYGDTLPGKSTYEAGTEISLVSDDQIKAQIENLGDLQFRIVANANDFQARGSDETTERQKLEDWWAKPENAEAPVSIFNALPPEQGGPVAGIQWYPNRLPEGAEFVPARHRQALPVIEPEEEDRFSGDDLETVRPSQDSLGYPAPQLTMNTTVVPDFREWTGEHEGRNMAMILNDEVISAPTINQRLGRTFIIEGRFSQDEVDEMVTVLRTGSLRIKPRLVSQERVTATLGQESVNRGLISALIGIGGVLGIMIVYYRALGVYAALALVANLVLLMGAMTFLQATLTLPGIAGIILTVGMAVDANILIFDRIREEGEKGRRALQSAQNGFQQAFSAIFDANVTTLITAFILYKVGTGPVRGFAVTLGWGILTSLFSALVITRVLVHFHLERGAREFPMMRFLADAKYDLLSKRKLAAIGSTIFIVAGVGLFVAIPREQKLGIDFLGGASVKVRTDEAQTRDTIEERIRSIGGHLGESAEVVALPASEVGDGLYTEFRITAKGGEERDDSGEDAAAQMRGEVKAALADVIQKGPIALATDPTAGTARAALYFEEEHRPDDVATVIESAGYSNVQVEARADRRDVVEVAFDTVHPQAQVLTTLSNAFAKADVDSAGAEFTLSEPVPETSLVGQQVVGELQEKAVQALLLSLFVVVIYIRVRFAEYSFGFAAMIAVLHDVLVTLGVMAIVISTGLIQVEINLPMIAAFLTIIGYSLNDTIVVFDRVRENRPRMKGTLRQIVNSSINQTLSRTVMTSLTTLATILVLFFFNLGTGSVLEGFTFALAIGVVVGTYSSIFIAAPAFVLLEERALRKAAAAKKGTDKKSGQAALASR